LVGFPLRARVSYHDHEMLNCHNPRADFTAWHKNYRGLAYGYWRVSAG
jgi:hypothetical protein